MAQFPVNPTLNVGATTNVITWGLIVADSDYWLMEADVAPAGSAAGNISALIGLIAGSGDLPNNSGIPTNNNLNTFSSTNKTFPTKYKEIWVGDLSQAPPLAKLYAVVNQEYKHLVGAIPIAHPPIIQRGDIVCFALKNLTGSSQNATFNLSAIRMSNYARQLMENYSSGRISARADAIGAALAEQ